MADPEMRVPSPEELADWLRSTRKEHGITQTALADRVGVSPSQISRIESRSGDASYETMYRIQRELLSIVEFRSGATRSVRDILAEKHEQRGETYGLVCTTEAALVGDVVKRMEALNISQLPVFSSDGRSVARITERDVLGDDCLNDPVEKHMRSPFPEVGAEAAAAIARDLLQTNPAVLVTVGATDEPPIEIELIGSADTSGRALTDHNYVGILTRADLVGGVA
jgi:predicted transcriptional regulator